MWFASMGAFEREWPTFCGENAQRLALIWPVLAREKLAVHGGADNDPVKGCLVNPDLVPTLEEYALALDKWIRDERETRISDGLMLDGTTPALAWAAGLANHAGRAVDADTQFVAFLRAFNRPRRVEKGAVVTFRKGESQRDWIRYHSRALEPFLISGEDVLVKVNVSDISHAYVFQWLEDRGWKLIDCGGPNGGCPSLADIPANTGMDDVREVTRDNRRRRKEIRTGLSAQEQADALHELRRSGAIRSDATDTETILTLGAGNLRDQLNARADGSRANRRALDNLVTDAAEDEYLTGAAPVPSESVTPF
jgi:hypothetical protein